MNILFYRVWMLSVFASLITLPVFAQTVPVNISTKLTTSAQNVVPVKASPSSNSKLAVPRTAAMRASDDVALSSQKTSTPKVQAKSMSFAAAASRSSSGGSSQIPTLNSVSVSVEPFSGGASVPVPISVPAGRAGIQPSVALVYSSNSPESFLGVGWSLDFGSIQRSTKKGTPKYDSTDSFVMTSNGSNQELIFDAAKNFYRPDIEGAFSKIQKVSDYWLVTDKKGTKYYFGQTDDAKLWHPEDHSNIFKWALNRVEDMNGNYMTITYQRTDNCNIYPVTIDYTGNSKTNLLPFAKVTFTYKSAGRTLSSNKSGFGITSTILLDTVDVKVNGALQSKYALTYTSSPATKRYLLSAVTQFGADGTSTLPAVNFTYQADKGFTFANAQWAYPSGMDLALNNSNGYVDNGTRLIDINGDVYPDLVRNTQETDNITKVIKTYLNSKNNSFNQSAVWMLPYVNYLTFVRGVNLDYGVRMLDVDGDGWQDAIWSTLYSSGFSSQKIYLNDHNGQFVEAPQWTMPTGIFVTREVVSNYTVFTGILYADVNGDGFVDIVWSKRGDDAGSTTYLNNAANGGTGWTYSRDWDVPIDSYTDFANGATLVDLNGDGLPEIVYAVDSSIVIHTNTGRGWGTAVVGSGWDAPPITANLRTGLTQFADMNGDGLADLVTADDNASSMHQLKVAINTGAGWFYDPAWDFWTSGFYNYTARLADMNADGMTDLLSSLNNGYDMVMNIGKPSDLLIKVDNGIGGTSELAYDSSAHYENTFLPFPLQVVKSLTVKDSFGSSYATKYVYSQGLWDAVEREFRGFGSVKVEDPDGNYAVTQYHQDKYFKGRPKEQAAYDVNDKLFSKSTNTWQRQTIIPGSDFVYLKRTDNFIYDGNATGQRTAQEFFYEEPEQVGNLTKVVSLGEVDLVTGADSPSNDKRTVTTTYLNNTSLMLLGLPKQITVFNHMGTMVRQTSMYYDNHAALTDAPTLGLLTKKIDWAGASAPQHPVTQYSYDAIGNLKTTTDPKGNVTTINYDAAFNIFPLSTVNAKSQTVTSEYYGVNGVPLSSGTGYTGLFGQVKSVTDANGQKSCHIYDTFGRMTKSISPFDTFTYPTIEVSYTLTPTYAKVKTKQRVTSGAAATIDSSSFYDGLGRLIQSKTIFGTSGTYVVAGQTQYNSRGLPVYKYIPRTTTNNLDTMDAINTSVARATITYDAMGRTIKVTNTDGTYSNTVYDDCTVTNYDEKGARTEMAADAYGRVFRVREYGGFDGRTSQYPAQAYWVYAATMYGYDGEGNLTTVTDAQNNVTTITYDALGRKTSMNDPDMKVWSYGYDLNGNLSTQTDAKAQVLSFNFDTLNRLTSKVSGAATLTGYTFDDAAVTFAKGRLTKASYGTDQATFAYDNLGRETSSTKKIDGVNSSVSRSYNALNNLLSLTYPDNMRVDYTYNQAGQIVTVKTTPSGGPTTTLVSAVTYNVNCQIKTITYGNGVVTTYTYHATNFRLTNMLTVKGTTKLQDFTYTYDVAGNILSITDAVKSVTQTFQYSHLNRLIKATGPWGTYTYSYDQIGNITAKEGVTYTYSKVNAGPHAVTSLSDGTSFTYDANGNMATMVKGADTTAYIYDQENRLKQVKKNGNLLAEFAYDGDGGRTKKITYSTTTPGQITGITTYVGSLQEKTSLATVDHVYLGSQLIASINNGVIRYAHQDHLGGTNVISDTTGAMIERLTYKPFGEVTREKFGSNQEVAWFYFTGKKLDDETGLLYYGARYYNPIIGRFLTPDIIVQSPLNPQTLNRYTYCNNNPINLIDPTGHSWLDKANKFLKKVFNGVVGFLERVTNSKWTVDINVQVVQTQQFDNPASGVKSALGFASTLAIQPWQVAVGVKNWFYDPRFKIMDLFGNNSVIKDGDKVFINGMLNTETIAINNATIVGANKIGYNPTDNVVADFVESTLQKLTFTSSIDRQLANLLVGHQNIDLSGHSQGAITVANALINLGFSNKRNVVDKVRYINTQVSQPRAYLSAALAGIDARHVIYSSRYFDPSNVVGPNLNPLKFISGVAGLIDFPYGVEHHAIQ